MNESQKARKDKFIQRGIDKHGDKFNYDKVVYKNNSTPVIITCPEHGDFEQTPRSHVNSSIGCPKCREENEERKVAPKNKKSKKEKVVKKTTEVKETKKVKTAKPKTPVQNIGITGCDGIKERTPIKVDEEAIAKPATFKKIDIPCCQKKRPWYKVAWDFLINW